MMTESKIKEAYVKLCAMREETPEASVSLALIGSHEIRMLADRRSFLMARRCFGWNYSITARTHLPTAAVAAGSKTLCL
jgi:hypothetical protein